MTAKRLYHINDTVKIEEVADREFKGLHHVPPSDRLRRMCEWTKEYANAFLNGDGGMLYFGIEDDGIVTGVELDRKGRDEIHHRLGQTIKEFYPAVDPTLWQIQLVPVYDTSDSRIDDLYVIELRFSRGLEDLYWPNWTSCDAYIKLPGGITRMTPNMVQQRCRRGRPSATDAGEAIIEEDHSTAAIEADTAAHRHVGSDGLEDVTVRRPSVTFTCRLPVVFGRGDDYSDAGGAIEFKTGDYRGLRVSLPSSEVRGSLMRGLQTLPSWQARPYLRPIDDELTEVTLGNAVLRLRKREVRDLCQGIDQAVGLYKQELIQTEDVLQTWEYELFERKDFIGVGLLQVPLKLWSLMHRFSQEFISPGNTQWHIFEYNSTSIRIAHGFSEHAQVWPLSDPYDVSWCATVPFDSVILAHQLSDFLLPLLHVGQASRQREWIQSVGEAGIWTAEYTKHWLLETFIPKVLEYYKDQIPTESRSALFREVKDLRLHQPTPIDSGDSKQLCYQVQEIQEWVHGWFNRIRRELILPYYESLLTLATHSERAQIHFDYISSRVSAVPLLAQEPSVSRPCETLDDVCDQLGLHVDRMRRTPVEEARHADLLSTVFFAFLEAGPKLTQRQMNEVKRGVEPIWREARFEMRHVVRNW